MSENQKADSQQPVPHEFAVAPEHIVAPSVSAGAAQDEQARKERFRAAADAVFVRHEELLKRLAK